MGREASVETSPRGNPQKAAIIKPAAKVASESARRHAAAGSDPPDVRRDVRGATQARGAVALDSLSDCGTSRTGTDTRISISVRSKVAPQPTDPVESALAGGNPVSPRLEMAFRCYADCRGGQRRSELWPIRSNPLQCVVIRNH
jgi:hypothetical protein